ncbi:MAG: hypothetical protein IT291_11000, partial [Deltaproteobacteria bacterium]|nr:hypothetical protein [Deltaproteobacteria bacterium]
MNIETNSDYPKLSSVQGSDNTSDSADIQVLATESSTDAQASEFGTMMRKILGTADGSQVNEEELFASLIENRLSKHSEEAATFYRQQKEGFLNTLRRADGYVSVEDAALKALKATVDAGKVDSATAEKVNSEAFKAAQLDDNADALYDGRGSAGDPTIAVSDLESALFSMRAVIEKIDVGDLESGSRSLESAPTSSAPTANGPSSTGNAQDGSGGFLWKPVSESDGKLVVLLPTELKGL